MNNRGGGRGKGAGTIVRVVCAALFLAFSIIYVYFYQADVLAVTQHALSHGQTRYSRAVGTPIIVAVLWVVQIWMYGMTRLEGSFHGFTYFPSMLLLAALTSADVSSAGHVGWGHWPWALPALIVVWAAVAIVMRRLQDFGVDHGSRGVLFRPLWVSVLSLAAMMLMVGGVARGDDVFHYRARAEMCLMRGDDKGAMAAGALSTATDPSLTMVRCYALARHGLLGDKLFTYPIAGGADDMVPMEGGATSTLIYPRDSVYRMLGAVPAHPMTATRYLELLELYGKAGAAVGDYRLCACLIERDLDTFASLLPHYYAIDDRLPRHYKEALILYSHLRAHPTVIYRDAALDTDFRDMQQMQAQCATREERRLRMLDHYFGTYWWYYEYDIKQTH